VIREKPLVNCRSKEVKKLNKQLAASILVFSLLMILTMVSPALAVVFSPPPYAETIGKLGGADFMIRTPNPITNWNGGLVVYCRGYLPGVPDITKVLSSTNPTSSTLISLGYAVAFSNYGEGGFCFQKAMIRTHQLTEWIADNYDVTGKIYVIGISMGGSMALELGAKYPDLYDGVIDLAGPKDYAAAYADGMYLASLPDVELLAEFARRGVTTYPLPPIPSVIKLFLQLVNTDTVIECGGTPESKPQAYERISPLYSAVDVDIPTVTLHGTKDGLSPYAQSTAYKNAVTAAGHSDLYRLYKVTGAQHGDAALFAQMFQAPYNAFYQLVDWVEKGTPASPSS
jgi:surfactin synthase thioesterase subunit